MKFALFAVPALLLLLPTFVGADVSPSADWWRATGLDRDGDRIDDALGGTTGPIRIVVDYDRPPGPRERADLARLARIDYEVRTVPSFVAIADASTLPRIRDLAHVVFVEWDRPIEPLLDESRVLVRADEAREDLDVTGEGVAIAVFDSGIDPNHPDLAEKIVASFDATIPRGLIPGLLDAQQIPVVPEYTGGHGTHVAGIAAGPGTESRGRFAGIAPGASLVNVKVFRQDGEGSTSYVLQGLDWILANRETLGVRVAVMSLGAPPTDGTDALSRAVDVAAERGVLTVAAAGNHGPDAQTVRVPGVAARALTVGAVDKTLRIGEFSSRGPTIDGRSKPDIVAVGVDVTSTVPVVTGRGEYYGTLSGTSMAGPMVAGAAALVFAANATLDPATAKYILVASSQAVGDNRHRWDPAYGWGLLDVEAAVRAARDPSILTLPPLSETARLVVPDDDVSPLVRLSFETERSGRAVPLFSQVLVVAALGLAALVGRRPRIRRPQHSLYERIPPSN